MHSRALGARIRRAGLTSRCVSVVASVEIICIEVIRLRAIVHVIVVYRSVLLIVRGSGESLLVRINGIRIVGTARRHAWKTAISAIVLNAVHRYSGCKCPEETIATVSCGILVA